MLFRPVEVLLRALFGCAVLIAWLKLSLFAALPFTPILALLALGPDPVGSTSRLDFVACVARGVGKVVKGILYVLAHVPDLLCLLAF